MKRAKTGGEVGLNGRRYEGGEFLPQSEDSQSLGSGGRRRDVHKQMVEPYKWERPAPGMSAIMDVLALNCFVRFNDDRRMVLVPRVVAQFGGDPGKIQELADRYNSGQRWFPAAERDSVWLGSGRA